MDGPTFYYEYDRDDALLDVDVGDGLPLTAEELLDEVFLPNEWQPSDADDQWTIPPPEIPVRPAADDNDEASDPLDLADMSIPTTYCTSSAEYAQFTPERTSSSRNHQPAATNNTCRVLSIAYVF